MLQINGKTFMNLQEAVQWLLDNNALPFLSSANYVANTEIGLGTVVNPSPAKVRIGSLIFFADSKVSTVIGLTENGFIVSDQYNDLVDDVVYVSNVEQNAIGHLIVTLSNGNTIDAGLIKQVANFAINASQHLIVTYNDGTNADLGALGDFTSADFKARTLEQTQFNASVTFNLSAPLSLTIDNIYNRFGVVNTVLHCIVNFKITNNTGASVTLGASAGYLGSASLNLPADVASKIYDIDGDTASDVGTNDTLIASVPCQSLDSKVLGSTTKFENARLSLLNRASANTIGVQVALNGDVSDRITLADGESRYITARMALTLL